MKHLYEYFGCKNMNELKQLVIKEDEKTRPLLSLYRKLQEPIALNEIKIGSTSDWQKIFLKNHNLPEVGHMILMKFNTKNHLLGYKTFSENARDKTLFNYLFSNDTVRFGILLNSKSQSKNEFSNKMYDLERTLEPIDINLLDALYFVQKECAYYSLREGMTSSYELPINILETIGQSKSKTRSIDYGMTRAEKKLINSKNFSRFTHEYCKQEMIGLNIIENEDKIKSLLKLDNQAHQKEYLGIISYDKDYKVSSYSIENIGGVNSSIAEPRSAMPYLNSRKTKGIIMYHNHPSGEPTPSQADINATERFKFAAELIDKELYDHYVISPKGVQSIADYESRGLLNDKLLIQNKQLKSINQPAMEER